MKPVTPLRLARLFSCWPSRLGAFSLVALAALMTLDRIASTVI